MKSHSPSHHKQAGLTLLEALISLLILALGVLGLAAVQTRMLVETRITNSRATAIRLIADLSERINLNKAGAQATLNSSGAITQKSAYIIDETTALGAVPAKLPGNACNIATSNTAAGACTPEAMAVYDLWQWRTQLSRSLMNGIGIITQESNNPHYLNVMVGWRLNEREGNALADELRVSFGSNTGDRCPKDYICHIDFIEIPVTK